MVDDAQQKLEAIRARFSAELPGRIQKIRAAFDQLELHQMDASVLSELQSLVHRLAGSAGTFGHDEVGEVAAQVAHRLHEISVADVVDFPLWDVLARDISSLEQVGLTRRPVPSESEQRDYRERLLHPRVDIVDDDADLTGVLASAIDAAGYQVSSFQDPVLYVDHCRRSGPPDVVLMDLDFPADGRIAGAEALAVLRAEFDPPPLAILISRHDDLRSRLAAYRAGACRYLLKPVDSGQLVQALDRLTSRAEHSAYRVMVVDDDERLASMNALILSNAGFEVEALSEPLQLLERLREFQPDVLLLDVYMPEASGPELAAVLREDESLNWLPILFLSAESDPSKHALALAHGGDDFLIKPVRPAYLLAAVKARAWRARRARGDLEALRSRAGAGSSVD